MRPVTIYLGLFMSCSKLTSKWQDVLPYDFGYMSVLLIGLCFGSNVVHAESLNVGAGLDISVTGNPTLAPGWKLSEVKDKYYISVSLVPKSRASAACFNVLALHEDAPDYRAVVLSNLNPGTAQSTCGEQLTHLNFFVYAVSKKNNLSIRWELPDSSLNNISEIQWTLYDNDSAKVLGRTGPGSQSFWGRDHGYPDGMDNSNSFALYLVDEISTTSEREIFVENRVPKPIRNTAKIASDLSTVSTANLVAPSARIGTPTEMDVVINWARGQSTNNLYLQVLADLSKPTEGLYCLRPIYSQGDKINLIVRGQNGWAVGSENIDSDSIEEVSASSCDVTNELMFTASINASAASLSRPRSKFSIGGGSRTLLPMKDAKIIFGTAGGPTLKRWYKEEGRWIAELVGEGARKADTMLAVIVRNRGSLPEEPVWVNQESVGKNKNGAEISEQLYKVDWSQFESVFEVLLGERLNSKVEESVQICDRDVCRRVVGDNYPLYIEKSTLQNYIEPSLVIDYGASPLNAVDSASTARDQLTAVESSTNAQSALKSNATRVNRVALAPTVSYGGYSRPLTGCIAELSVAEEIVSTSSLKNAVQFLNGVPNEAFTSPSDWNISFKKHRSGEDCPASDLPSLSFEQIINKQTAVGEPIPLELPTGESLFVGYLHLGKSDYRDSYIRWDETVKLFNRMYEYGRNERSNWIDGVIFGPTKNTDEVALILEPKSNFVKTLDGGAGLSSLTDDIFNRAKEGSFVGAFSEEQFEAIRSYVGDAKVSLLYFDDNAGNSCSDYELELQSSQLNLQHAVIIAASDEYGSERFPRSDSVALDGGYVDRCYTSDLISVYAFNSREININKNWDIALDTIMEDFSK